MGAPRKNNTEHDIGILELYGVPDQRLITKAQAARILMVHDPRGADGSLPDPDTNKRQFDRALRRAEGAAKLGGFTFKPGKPWGGRSKKR